MIWIYTCIFLTFNIAAAGWLLAKKGMKRLIKHLIGFSFIVPIIGRVLNWW